MHPDPDSRPALGMDASHSLDVQFREVPITEEMIVGRDGWYVRRRGFRLGSGGVAAVWLGGAMVGYGRALAPRLTRTAELILSAVAASDALRLIYDAAQDLPE